MDNSLVLVGPFPPPLHGASRVTDQLLDELDALNARANSGVSVYAVSTSGGALDRGLGYHARRIAAHLRAIGVVARLRSNGTVGIYIAGAGGSGLWYQFALVAWAALLRVRVFFHHHNYSYLGGKRYLSVAAISWLMNCQDWHIVLSEKMATDYRARYKSRAQVVVSSNSQWVPASEVHTESKSKSIRLIHVSNLSTAKGSAAVIEAFRVLRRRRSDVTLTLVGPCSEAAVLERIESARSEFGSSFQHLGPQSPVGVINALATSSIFVFPTNYVNEAQPLVVLEALSVGLPVVASRRGSIESMLPQKWLLDATSPETIAAKVEELAAVSGCDLAAEALQTLREEQPSDDERLAQLLLRNVQLAASADGGSSESLGRPESS